MSLDDFVVVKHVTTGKPTSGRVSGCAGRDLEITFDEKEKHSWSPTLFSGEKVTYNRQDVKLESEHPLIQVNM